MKIRAVALAVSAVLLTSACQRISTGEVGIRVGFDKQVVPGELLPGSFNQTLVGDVLTFPVKDVAVEINDLTPIARDNSTMADFDLMVIRSVVKPRPSGRGYKTRVLF